MKREARLKEGIKGILGKIGLSIKFSAMTFCILSLAALISSILLHLIVAMEIFPIEMIKEGKVIPLTALISCSIIGTILAMCASHSTLKTVERFIAASNQLAHGDFNARIEVKHPAEFRIMAENFNHMAKELGSIEVLRSDFINNFSHEFKTPIVSIKGFAEILKCDDLTEEERQEYLDIVIEESERLSSLASNVLDLSKIEQQGILSNKREFNIGEQIRQSILLLEAKINKKQIELDLHIHDYNILGNKEMMSQVWLNLLDNAIKFSKESGCISIIMRKEEQVVIEIRDNGCGISEEALPKIFDKFYQADLSHKIRGNGLGLCMVKKILELHEGNIICESKLGQGTNFKISLPTLETV